MRAASVGPLSSSAQRSPSPAAPRVPQLDSPLLSPGLEPAPGRHSAVAPQSQQSQRRLSRSDQPLRLQKPAGVKNIRVTLRTGKREGHYVHT